MSLLDTLKTKFSYSKNMKENKNLFDLAMGWYMTNDPGKKAAALDLFPEEMLKREIDAFRKRDRDERVKLREEYLQKMLKRCKKLFHVGDVIENPEGTYKIPHIILSEPYIQKVEYLPYCVDDRFICESSNKKTIFVDTVGVYMNEPDDHKIRICLEELLYYMDKDKSDSFRKDGFIDLKEFSKVKIEEKESKLEGLKNRESRLETELDDVRKKIASFENYDPTKFTKERVKEIIKQFV